MRESRIVLPPNAGVAELADALDSKSAVMLRSNAAIAVLLPNQRILVAPLRIALECELISALLGGILKRYNRVADYSNHRANRAGLPVRRHWRPRVLARVLDSTAAGFRDRVRGLLDN